MTKFTNAVKEHRMSKIRENWKEKKKKKRLK